MHTEAKREDIRTAEDRIAKLEAQVAELGAVTRSLRQKLNHLHAVILRLQSRSADPTAAPKVGPVALAALRAKLAKLNADDYRDADYQDRLEQDKERLRALIAKLENAQIADEVADEMRGPIATPPGRCTHTYVIENDDDPAEVIDRCVSCGVTRTRS